MAEFSQPRKDKDGNGFIKANFTIKDVRYMYDGLSFYLQNGNQEKEEYERIMKIKNVFYTMLLEHSFHT
tara:strand:+ start:375 stop:581 length:207 start_codon:yes stop_codon:yes gene_type:complete